MSHYTNGTEIKLSGNWNLSGIVLQIESLSRLHQAETNLKKPFHVDCSEIRSVDMSGLQLLHVWMHCVSLRGIKPELINLPEIMLQSIRQLGLEKSFLDFNSVTESRVRKHLLDM